MFLFIISFLKDTIAYLYLSKSNVKSWVIHEDRDCLRITQLSNSLSGVE